MRLLPTILAAVSAVFCVVVVFFWARSYSYYEGIVRYRRSGGWNYVIIEQGQRIERRSEGRTAGLISRQGSLTLSSVVDPRQEEWTWFSWSHPGRQELQPNAMSLMYPTLPTAGFSIGSGRAIQDLTTVDFGRLTVELPYWRVTIPYILLALLTAILPVRWVMNYRLVARREREGRCVYCGHDLAGQATGNCPACKQPVAA
jgi:hypothetical protein